MDIENDTAAMNAMLANHRRRAAQERDEAAQSVAAAAGTDALDQVQRQATVTIDYFTGRHDACTFVLDDMEASIDPEEIGSFLDQRLTEYIADADSLQKVKGFSSVVAEVNDFRLSL